MLVSGHGLVSVHHLQSYLSDPLQMLQEVKHGVCSLVEAVKCIQPLATEIEVMFAFIAWQPFDLTRRLN